MHTDLYLKIRNALVCIQDCPGPVLQSIKPLLHFLLKGSLLIPATDHQSNDMAGQSWSVHSVVKVRHV